MTVAELRRVCAGANPNAEVLVRIDDEALENPRGLVFEILSSEYSMGCTDTYALMLDCGQSESKIER